MSSKEEMTQEAVSKMNIYQRIWAVASEVGRVQMSLDVATKTDKNGKVVKSYKAVSINDVVDSLLPMLEKYRLTVIPHEKEIIHRDQLVTASQYGDRVQFWVSMRCSYKIVNIDNGEFVISEGYGDGIDSGDKAFGKSITYCRKVALIDAFNLSRGDDPDREASLEYKAKNKPTAHMLKTVENLYKPEEITYMLKNLNARALSELSEEQVHKMIVSRQKPKEELNLNDQSETF